MNWYIGQKIIAINSPSHHLFKKGDEFTIKGLKGSGCACNYVVIDVGIKSPYLIRECFKCKTARIIKDDILWSHEANFAPLESIPESHCEAIKELLKEELHEK